LGNLKKKKRRRIIIATAKLYSTESKQSHQNSLIAEIQHVKRGLHLLFLFFSPLFHKKKKNSKEKK